MPSDNKIALMLSNIGLGDQICLIPSLKKLKERFGKFDILYTEPFPTFVSRKLGFYDEAEYISNYRHANNNLAEGIQRNDIILYDELKYLPQPSVWEMLKTPEHISILYLKQLTIFQ